MIFVVAVAVAAGQWIDPDKRFYCVVCGRNYLRKANLLRHARHECIGIPPQFHCHFCVSKYRRKEDLVRHVRNKHESVKLETKLDPILSALIGDQHNLTL